MSFDILKDRLTTSPAKVTYQYVVGFYDQINRLVATTLVSSMEDLTQLAGSEPWLANELARIPQPFSGMIQPETFGAYPVPDSETFMSVSEWSNGLIRMNHYPSGATISPAPSPAPALRSEPPRVHATPAPVFLRAEPSQPQPVAASLCPTLQPAAASLHPAPAPVAQPTLRPAPAPVAQPTLRPAAQAAPAPETVRLVQTGEMRFPASRPVSVSTTQADIQYILLAGDRMIGFFAPGYTRDDAERWLKAKKLQILAEANELYKTKCEEEDEDSTQLRDSDNLPDYLEMDDVDALLEKHLGIYAAETINLLDDIPVSCLDIRHVEGVNPIIPQI